MQIEHIAVWACDIETLRSFYEKYFNAKSSSIYRNDKKQFSSYFLSFDSGTRLEIMHVPSLPEGKSDPAARSQGLVHMAFSTGSEENVRVLTERLSNDGYEVLDTPRRTGDGYYESIILDPEGNRIEITV